MWQEFKKNEKKIIKLKDALLEQKKEDNKELISNMLDKVDELGVESFKLGNFSKKEQEILRLIDTK